MRITRVGSLVTGYVNGDEVYSRTYDTEPAFFRLALQNNGTKDATSVTFDDFYLAANEIEPVIGDINLDDYVNLYDFARLASWWLCLDCNTDNNWCYGADQDHSEDIDLIDLMILSSNWLCNGF
jgi:hypothetical protein